MNTHKTKPELIPPATITKYISKGRRLTITHADNETGGISNELICRKSSNPEDIIIYLDSDVLKVCSAEI